MGTVLVTGALGYVGGRVARQFAEEGWRTVAFARRPPSSPPEWPTGVQLVVADDFQSPALDFTSIDAVVHLGTANEVICNRDVAAAFQANAVGTYRLLERCRQGGVRRFIYFSTVHVYGSPLVGELTEAKAVHPSQPYAVAHLAGENFTRAAAGSGLTTIVVRLSNAVGAPVTPVDRWTLVANDLCREAVLRGTLTLKSDGEQWRNFISLGDVARAVVHLAGLPMSAASAELFNLAGPEAIRVIDLTNMIAERAERRLGRRPEIHRPAPGNRSRPAPLSLSVDKLRAAGFAFSIPLAEEIDNLLRYCAQ